MLVSEVRNYMKMHKLSQVTVGQEARISQAVISQWLSLKYHGHNDKVGRQLTRASTFASHLNGVLCRQVDAAMTAWLKTRKAGIEVIPNPNDPTSVLRPSRATTVGEKQEMKRRKMQNKGQDGKEKKMKRDLQDLQAHAAAEGCATHFALAALLSRQRSGRGPSIARRWLYTASSALIGPIHYAIASVVADYLLQAGLVLAFISVFWVL